MEGDAVWSGAGQVRLDTQAALRVEAGGSLEFQGGATLSSSGSPASTFTSVGEVVNATGGATFAISLPVTHSGLIDVRSGTLRFTSSMVQTGGTLRLAGGGVSTTSVLDIRGGMVTGQGSITGTLRNSGGLVRPARVLDVLGAGGWTNVTGGTVQVELGGVTPGVDHDRLVTTGRAALGGTLELVLGAGFQPKVGDTFEVLRFASSTGGFGVYRGLSPTPDVYLKPTLTSTSLVMVAIEPPKPVFSSPALVEGEGLRLRITEAAGLDVVIDASEDLLDWAPILTNRSSPAILDLVDPDALNYPHRFYRIRLE